MDEGHTINITTRKKNTKGCDTEELVIQVRAGDEKLKRMNAD